MQGVEQLRGMNLSSGELEVFQGMFPGLEEFGPFQDLLAQTIDMEGRYSTATRQAKIDTGLWTDELVDISTELNKTITNMEGLANAIDQANKLQEPITPEGEALNVQIAAYEQLKAAADAAGKPTEQFDNILAGLNARLAENGARVATNQALISLYAAAVFQTSGNFEFAGAEAMRFSEILAGLPVAQQVKITAALPFLELNRLAKLIDLIVNKKYSIEIALKMAMAQEKIIPEIKQLPGSMGGELGGAAVQHNADALAQALRDLAFVGGNAAAESAGAALNADDSSDKLNKTEFGLLELAKAFEIFSEITGSKSIPAFKAWLEIQQKLVEAQEEHNLRLEQARNPLLAMNMAFAAIRTRVLETNGTIETFLRNDVFMPALNNFKSALGDLFGEPPREVQELQLRKAQLELQRAERVRAGAKPSDLKNLDKQIDAIDKDIDLIIKRVEVYKRTAELMDQTIKTEQEILDQSIILGKIIYNASSSVRLLDGAATFAYLTLINLGNSFNEVAAINRSGGGAAAVAALRAGPTASATGVRDVNLSLTLQGANRAQIQQQVMKALDDALVYDSFAGNSVRSI